MTGSYPSSPCGPSGLDGGARYCHLVAVCSQHLSRHTSSGGLGSPHPRCRDWWRIKQMLGMISAPALSASTKCNPGLPGQGERVPWQPAWPGAQGPEKWTEAPGLLPLSSSGHLLLLERKQDQAIWFFSFPPPWRGSPLLCCSLVPRLHHHRLSQADSPPAAEAELASQPTRPHPNRRAGLPGGWSGPWGGPATCLLPSGDQAAPCSRTALPPPPGPRGAGRPHPTAQWGRLRETSRGWVQGPG